jgi:hypothetical protein
MSVDRAIRQLQSGTKRAYTLTHPAGWGLVSMIALWPVASGVPSDPSAVLAILWLALGAWAVRRPLARFSEELETIERDDDDVWANTLGAEIALARRATLIGWLASPWILLTIKRAWLEG